MYSFYNSTVIYVSQTQGHDGKYNGFAPDGDSNGSGPFKTLRRALAAVKELRDSGNGKPMTVALTEDYYLSAPIDFADGVCGVTIESHGERRRIIGGIKAEGWKRDTFNGVSCFSTLLPKKETGGIL